MGIDLHPLFPTAGPWAKKLENFINQKGYSPDIEADLKYFLQEQASKDLDPNLSEKEVEQIIALLQKGLAKSSESAFLNPDKNINSIALEDAWQDDAVDVLQDLAKIINSNPDRKVLIKIDENSDWIPYFSQNEKKYSYPQRIAQVAVYLRELQDVASKNSLKELQVGFNQKNMISISFKDYLGNTKVIDNNKVSRTEDIRIPIARIDASLFLTSRDFALANISQHRNKFPDKYKYLNEKAAADVYINELARELDTFSKLDLFQKMFFQYRYDGSFTPKALQEQYHLTPEEIKEYYLPVDDGYYKPRSDGVAGTKFSDFLEKLSIDGRITAKQKQELAIDYSQSYIETIYRTENNKMLGDCEDQSLFFKEILHRQGKLNAQTVEVTVTNKQTGEVKNHVTCVYIDKEHGRYIPYRICTYGLYQGKNTYPDPYSAFQELLADNDLEKWEYSAEFNLETAADSVKGSNSLYDEKQILADFFKNSKQEFWGRLRENVELLLSNVSADNVLNNEIYQTVYLGLTVLLENRESLAKTDKPEFNKIMALVNELNSRFSVGLKIFHIISRDTVISAENFKKYEELQPYVFLTLEKNRNNELAKMLNKLKLQINSL